MSVPDLIAPPAEARDRKRRRWETTTVAALTVGYAAYYFGRANLSVAAPLLLDAFGAQGLDKATLGAIASTGVLLYALGKLVNGVGADFLGGRRLFLFGMGASVLAVVWFGLGAGVATFTAAWAVNRFVQSMGWGGLVKTAAAWVPYRRYGQVMGVLSLSFLLGDALARYVLGGLIGRGLSWQGVFFVSAAVMGGVLLVELFVLKARPESVGLAPPPAHPDNVYGAAGESERPASLRALLGPLLRSPAFWLVTGLSFGMTLIREAFGFWTPTYLTEAAGMSASAAAMASLLYPLCGAASVLASGWASDRLVRGRRGPVMAAGLLPLVGVLAAMTLGTYGPTLSLVLVGVAAFCMIGPYAFLAGAVSLDLGGKSGSATVAGLVDSAGYVGGVFSGWGVGLLAERFGWTCAFGSLAAVAAVTLVLAVIFWRTQERPAS